MASTSSWLEHVQSGTERVLGSVIEFTSTVDQYLTAQTEDLARTSVSILRRADRIEDCIDDLDSSAPAGAWETSTDHNSGNNQASVSNAEHSGASCHPRRVAVGRTPDKLNVQPVTGARSPLQPTTPMRSTSSMHEHAVACCDNTWELPKGSGEGNLLIVGEAPSHSSTPESVQPVSMCPIPQTDVNEATSSVDNGSYTVCKDGRSELEHCRALNGQLSAQVRHFQVSCEQLQREVEALKARASMHGDGGGTCSAGADVMVDQLAMQLQDVMRDRARLKSDNDRLECEYMLLEMKLATAAGNADECEDLTELAPAVSDENVPMKSAASV